MNIRRKAYANVLLKKHERYIIKETTYTLASAKRPWKSSYIHQLSVASLLSTVSPLHQLASQPKSVTAKHLF